VCANAKSSRDFDARVTNPRCVWPQLRPEKIRRLAYGFRDTMLRNDHAPQRPHAAKSLAKRPKPAQPSHHSDIQVTHDYRHDPAGNTDLHRCLGRDGFPCSMGTNTRGANRLPATIDFGVLVE
jgi:hypothetical protein